MLTCKVTIAAGVAICAMMLASYAALTAPLHVIDRGVWDGEQVLPGALLTVNLTTGAVADADNLSGPCLFSCYHAPTGRLFVSDPAASNVVVFQTP